MAEQQLRGSLEDFKDWCLGKTRVGGTIHYSAVAAIERYQLFKKNQELIEKETRLEHTIGAADGE